MRQKGGRAFELPLAHSITSSAANNRLRSKNASYFSDGFVSSIGNSTSIIRPASCGACSAMRL